MFVRHLAVAVLLAASPALAAIPAPHEDDEIPCIIPPPATNSLAHELREGALVLFNEVAAGHDNAVFSPYAVQTVMGMMYASASDATADDVARTMGWSADPGTFKYLFRSLNASLDEAVASSPNAVLERASRLWSSTRHTVVPAYASALEEYFGASIVPLDLTGALDESRATINAWVDAQTSHAIPQLLPPNSLKESTLVQTAALHFKAPWSATFTRDSETSPFYVNEQATSEATMVRADTYVPYAATAKYQAADIPYAGNSLSMLVIMPNGDLPTFAASLDGNGLEAVQAELQLQRVALALPVFEARTTPDMTAIFQALGLNVSMTNAARFNIYEDVGTKILHVFEQAWIAVDERGTEAAAAAAVEGGATSMPLPPTTTLTLDHPFLFVIHDNLAGIPLFIGQVSRPAADVTP